MSHLAHFDDANFEADVLKSQLPVLVDFFATWCAPCQSLTPIVEELAREYAGKVKVGKVDVDASSAVPAKYGIMAVPTMILFKDGKEIEKITGFTAKAQLRRRLDALIAA